MLNEKQAWAFCAKRWKNAMRGQGLREYYYVGDNSYGLCHTIDDLSYSFRISNKTYEKMQKKIERRQQKDGKYSYIWGFGKSGRDARVRFCEKQVKLLSDEKVLKS